MRNANAVSTAPSQRLARQPASEKSTGIAMWILGMAEMPPKEMLSWLR